MISSCLIGKNVRYDGGSHPIKSEVLERWRREGRLVAVCPEVVGGMPVPRPASEIVTGDRGQVLKERKLILNIDGRDVTAYFLEGARQTLQLVQKERIRMAVLKSRSPSCGKDYIYDGTFSGALKKGDGVTTALLKREGIAVFTEAEIEAADQFLEKLESEK